MPDKIAVRFLICLLSVFSVPLCCRSAEPPTFTLDTAAGKTLKGPLRELRPGWFLKLGDSSAEGADIVALRRDGIPLPPGPDGGHVVFANGDRLPGTIGDLDGDRLGFHLGKEALSLPLSALSVLWWAAPDGAEPDRLLRRLATESRTRDRILLRNGDAVEGILTGLDARVLRLEVNRKELTVERSKAAVVALNTELSTTLKPKTAYGRLVLRDGTRLSLASATCADGQMLLGDTLFKTGVSFPLEEVVSLSIEGGPAVYLSELKVRKYEHNPYLGAPWPYVLNGSVDRRDLRLGGSTFDRGVGLHTESRLTYDLGGRYHRFEALVGLDDQTGKGGSARIQVLVDGKPKDLGNTELTGRSEPLAIRVDVTGAKELTIVADFGERGGVRGHVNWANARLIK
jgi:NPCBM/NEW2 domain